MFVVHVWGRVTFCAGKHFRKPRDRFTFYYCITVALGKYRRVRRQVLWLTRPERANITRQIFSKMPASVFGPRTRSGLRGGIDERIRHACPVDNRRIWRRTRVVKSVSRALLIWRLSASIRNTQPGPSRSPQKPSRLPVLRISPRMVRLNLPAATVPGRYDYNRVRFADYYPGFGRSVVRNSFPPPLLAYRARVHDPLQSITTTINTLRKTRAGQRIRLL